MRMSYGVAVSFCRTTGGHLWPEKDTAVHVPM